MGNLLKQVSKGLLDTSELDRAKQAQDMVISLVCKRETIRVSLISALWIFSRDRSTPIQWARLDPFSLPGRLGWL